MQNLPLSAARRLNAPPAPRLRWRVFARFLAVFAGTTTMTLIAILLAQRTLSREAAGWAAIVIEIGGCATAALLLSQWLELRIQRLIHTVEVGVGLHDEELAADADDDLFEDVIPSWQTALQALRDTRQEKQDEACLQYQTLTELMRMVAKAVDERTAYLRGHSERVAEYAAEIAKKLGLDPRQTERVRLAALLHDIGCLGVADSVALKETPLTAEEFEIVKAHTVKGAAILRPIPLLQDLVPGVELHHESLDGLGYPYGLKGEQIPLMARIVAVADSFDAMTTPRPYQAAMNADYVLDILKRLAGTRYDAQVVAALTDLVTSGAIEVRKVRTPISFRMRTPVAV
ncbi:MAG: HD-GYP domain-containing protein [Acidobacteriaceae bacterium]